MKNELPHHMLIDSDVHILEEGKTGTFPSRQNKWDLPEMILIAGDGRNVGKTTFASRIIHHISQKTNVIGLKTSSHFHELTDDLKIISKTEDFIVAEELGISGKDSSLFLQAGAKRVFFIMAEQAHLEQALSVIIDQLEHQHVVAESGGLIGMIKPGIFFFVRNQQDQVKKDHYLNFRPIQVMNRDHHFDFDINRVHIREMHLEVKYG